MAVKISTLGGALLSLQAPDRQGLLADLLLGGQAGDGLHLLPAPGRALHRQAWHAVPLVEEASVGVRLVSPGAPAVVARYALDDGGTLALHCEVAADAPAALCLAVTLRLDGQLMALRAGRVVPAGAHEQDVAGGPWDFDRPRLAAELTGPARYLPGGGGGLALRLLDPAGGRQLELEGGLASLRIACGEPAGTLRLEPVLAAPGGRIAFRCSAQT
ncbi:hypothetical protein [Pseudoduganella sp.]|uniref:hypothetical protein n=1 Tax=Pseudoduganella sp. TaxID=1880898 RepID=UPI0035B423BC